MPEPFRDDTMRSPKPPETVRAGFAGRRSPVSRRAEFIDRIAHKALKVVIFFAPGAGNPLSRSRIFCLFRSE
jgi:hypothetical protein